MKCFLYSILLMFLSAVNGTFWYKNDDFERAMDPYKSNLSQEYLRALSIFKRKLQLLGFYPIVLNDDGLEYVSMDPYLIEDDDDDEMYKLLKKIKKEKKARKKSQKKKSKKSKKGTEAPPVETTTVQPISNIVYYWPSAITTIVHPSGQDEDTSTYQHSIDTRLSIGDSSDENSAEAEVDASSKDQIVKIDQQKPAKINYQTTFSFGRRFDNDDVETRPIKNQTLPPTTTAYPLLTVVPDPEQVAIQEIIDQQEIVNKISIDQVNATKTVGQDHVDRITDTPVADQDHLTTNETIQVTEEAQVYEESPSYSQDKKVADEIPEENVPFEASTVTTVDVSSVSSITSVDDSTTELSAYSTEPSPSIPIGALQFFHETLPDEHDVPISLPNLSEIFDSITESNSANAHISDKVEETTENNANIDGHRETDTQHGHSIVQLNEKSSTAMPPLDDHLTTPKSTDGTTYTELEITIPTNTNSDSEGYEYLIDPKITRPIKVLDGLESRSLTDEPIIVAVDVKSGRRSDVPIEADDINEEDTTDNLAYNLIDDKLELVENTSAEMSTSPPVEAVNYDNHDQFDGEIIPLIPIIIKQMKQGNVSPDEMEIMKNSFGPFWPFIVEEASRESDSSEEMNPLLNELLNSANRKIVKREATFGRPIYQRRIYVDDDDDAPRRRYIGRFRRPYLRYYLQK
ncbi:uncharacterized protein LOC119081900 [Bradysia coprophila]|uniref:uncharacterized protein LOC119081900 n=1 Tax=Bradysia coprophila TaxID=38358 RepID=UPI00187DD0B1|nr:uncharacterized protein LOC119081900 [Bradysia coprophila]